MECGMYYLHAKNKYTVHFLNAASLSIEEIRAIFGEFGEITGLTTSGDAKGMRFVSYKTLKETINCIIGLRNHKLVKILPERSKFQRDVDRKDDISESNASRSSNYFRAKRNKKSLNKNDVTNNVTHQNLFNGDAWDDSTDMPIPAQKKQQIVKGMTHHDEQDGNEDSENNESSIKSFESSRVSRKPAKSHIRSNIVPNKDIDKFHDFYNLNTHSDSGASSLKDNESYINQIPSLIRVGTSEHDRSIESLSDISCSSHNIVQPKIVIAEHIIVANVPSDFSIHFILHLFHKYDPIAVSLMKKIHKTGIRYCHVYFKNSKDALEVEQKFDNYALKWGSLIVMRSQSLLKEVMME